MILLADILPTLVIKTICPWFMHLIPYWSVNGTGSVSCLNTSLLFCISQCTLCNCFTPFSPLFLPSPVPLVSLLPLSPPLPFLPSPHFTYFSLPSSQLPTPSLPFFPSPHFNYSPLPNSPPLFPTPLPSS